jgi:hypothetical protein
VTTVQAGTVSAPAITTTGDTNTGIFFPAADTIAFSEGGSEAMRIDSSGNLGLGVTPSAWGSGRKVLQMGTTPYIMGSGTSLELLANAYYNGTNWINLKGVEDLDGNTKITAELTEGSNDGVIRFYIDGVQVIDINSTRLNAPQIIVDDITLDGNVITTNNGDKNLSLTANGAGSVVFDNFAFKNNTITNTVSDSITLFENTNNGYVKFDGTYGLVLPAGTTGQRPPTEYSEVGMTRFNITDSRVEVWNGNEWISVAGTESGISRSDAENIAFERVLILG